MDHQFNQPAARPLDPTSSAPALPGLAPNVAPGKTRSGPGGRPDAAATVRPLRGFGFGETNWNLARHTEELHSETLRMRSAGEREARGWQDPTQTKGHKLLKQRWSGAAAAIAAATRRSRRHQLVGAAAKQATGQLRNNSRLIEVALEEARETVRAAPQLPVVATARHQRVPRSYAAVVAYLRLARFQFEEGPFTAFVLGIQEAHPLRLREVWALRALAQLAFLERLGRAVRCLFHRHGAPDATNRRAEKAAVWISTCLAGLRALDVASWREICEDLGVVTGILRDDPCCAYAKMDADSRDLCLQQVDQLGRHSPVEEPEIARRAVALAASAQHLKRASLRAVERRSHVGFFLVGEGRPLLERQIHYRPPPSERVRKAIRAWPEVFYFLGIELLTFAIIAFLLIGARAPVSLIAAFILLVLPVTEAAWGVMNQVIMSLLPPRPLPKLDFSAGIPPECATLVVVPTLLLNEAYVRRLAADLEVRFLANRDPHLFFALLTDAPDSPAAIDPGERLVTLCSRLISELNRKYSDHGRSVFFLFHRSRTFNPGEGAWMGWERKRGKLIELNELLRGASDGFPIKEGELSTLPQIKYVIVVDSDTQLPPGVARRLVATLAHPLNRAVIDPRTNTVVEGYGILQPRVGISVQSASRSLLANIYSGDTGFDLYARAISDVYQDLFGEGSFTGKGIYEVDVLRQVLGKRFPCNSILSHDLIEGTYARAGLVSDLEVIDDYPTHFSAYSRRKHRWVRGDWQIIRWLLPRVPDYLGKGVPNPLSVISRWKIFDNLRRSLVEIATFVLLLAGWFALPGSPRRWTLVVVVLMLIPVYLQFLLSLLRVWPSRNLVERLKDSLEGFIAGQINVFFTLVFLSHQTLVLLDAIVRTLVRVTITRRRLLQWETAAQAEHDARRTPVDSYLTWTPWLSLAIGAALTLARPAALPDAAPFLILWACAGPVARWLNRPLHPGIVSLSHKEEELLRSVCLRTWRFFRQAAQESGNGLAPDNIQEAPPNVAHRISPTNLGLLLDSQLAAYQLGYLTLPEFVLAAERIMESAKGLRRYRGHFLNWYDTETLAPLEPLFVSTVDSGNLVCSLWALKQGCLQALHHPLLRGAARQSLHDHLSLLDELAGQSVPRSREAYSLRKIYAQFDLLPEQGSAWVCVAPGLADDLRDVLRGLKANAKLTDELRWWVEETIRRAEAIQDLVQQLLPWMSAQNWTSPSLTSNRALEELSEVTLSSLWTAVADLSADLERIAEIPGTNAVVRYPAKSLRGELPGSLAEAERLRKQLKQLVDDTDQLVQEMDFRFLYNSSRALLSVGYDLGRRELHASCYDLLASEARSAVFAAIAKGDIPPKSWSRLGRSQARWSGQCALLSWSGTMFEYLMPALWFEHRPHTLLGETVRAAVQFQIAWAGHRFPWGSSEAAYSARDGSGSYQYAAFGMPDLALNPVGRQGPVIAPYATFLALSVDPRRAVHNLQKMSEMNWLGPLGFYDAADFAPGRAAPPDGYQLVRCWMAHHQGMSLLAACNLLTGDAIQNLFHAEPAVRAAEMLLHEKPSHAAPRTKVSIKFKGNNIAPAPSG